MSLVNCLVCSTPVNQENLNFLVLVNISTEMYEIREKFQWNKMYCLEHRSLRHTEAQRIFK